MKTNHIWDSVCLIEDFVSLKNMGLTSYETNCLIVCTCEDLMWLAALHSEPHPAHIDSINIVCMQILKSILIIDELIKLM